MAKALAMQGSQSTAPRLQSLQALDWLNYFIAAQLAGLGPFAAIKLADRGWMPASIGVVLTMSGAAGLLTQVPAGELIDIVRSKRMLVGMGVVAVTFGVVIFGLRPDFPSVIAAVLIQGVAGSILGPGVAAISLGIVGQEALAERLGRNQRFAAIGGLTAAGFLGAIGYLVSIQDVFLVTAVLGIPVLCALTGIHATEIRFARSCCAPDDDPIHPKRISRALLFRDRRLLVFSSCLFLFQFANASVLPLIGETLVRVEKNWSSFVMSALIVVPQVVVALLAPWVGRTAGTWGRRPLLLIGIGVVPIRSISFALTANPELLVLIQVLDGLSGATLGVLTTLVVGDIAKGTGRFNLAQGVVGTLSGVGASLSTSISGLVAEQFGPVAGFFSLTAVGLVAVALLWALMPETKARHDKAT
jgi:MFS family permease